jgi:hypothetical protein
MTDHADDSERSKTTIEAGEMLPAHAVHMRYRRKNDVSTSIGHTSIQNIRAVSWQASHGCSGENFEKSRNNMKSPKLLFWYSSGRGVMEVRERVDDLHVFIAAPRRVIRSIWRIRERRDVLDRTSLPDPWRCVESDDFAGRETCEMRVWFSTEKDIRMSSGVLYLEKSRENMTVRKRSWKL